MDPRTKSARVATRPGSTDDERSRRARAVLAQASSATLLTDSCPLGVGVDLGEQAGGRPVVVVAAGSPAEVALRRCPMATLVVSGASGSAVHLVASYRPVRCEQPGRRLFRPTLLFVHLVEGERHAVPVEVFQSPASYAAPAAEALLAHWTGRHQTGLRAALPTGAGAGEVLLATGMDRDVLVVQALGPEGVTTHRLPHPGGPLDDPAQVALAHGLPVGCPCA